MPIYEYVCSNCHHQLEAMQSIKDPPLKQCPECKRRTLKKVVSATGFVLKGTGWYVTDFRDKGGAKQDKSADGKPESAGESKTAKEKPDTDTKKAAAKDSPPKKPKGKASAS